MLALFVDTNAYVIEEMATGFRVEIGQSRIDFAQGSELAEQALERLAIAIEAWIALDRAQAMLAASGSKGDGPPPLWLVSGSNILADWLVWSRMQGVLGRSLAFSDGPGIAPVTAYLERRSRRELGQGAIKIRVNGGVALLR